METATVVRHPGCSRRQLLLLAAALPAAAQSSPRKPVLDGEPWKLCTMPDLGELNGPDPTHQHIVDHGFFQLPNGKWRVWACMRGTAPGRIFFGWEGDSLDRGPWRPLGITARASAGWGEAGAGAPGREVMQAPHVILIDGVYHMFYSSGGIRLMTSRDGITFERADLGGARRNLLYADGGRDPMAIRIGDLYYVYSTVSTRDRQGYIIVKTSRNLHDWSEAKIVCRGGRAGDGPISAESPFVVALDGYYYLLRASSTEPVTFVYASKDPTNFGIDDDSNLIAQLPLKAPEIVHHEGAWYVSDLADFQALLMRRMHWS